MKHDEKKDWKEQTRQSNAKWKAMFPEPIEKEKELEEIKQEINAHYEAIGQNYYKVRKLIFDSVHFAKRIGDKLLRVKQLVGHGHYEKWVEKNFTGGLSTARAYTRIAKHENWKRIASKLTEWGDMTIESALSLLRTKGPEVEKDKRWLKLIEHLAKRLEYRAGRWPEHVILRFAYNDEIMDDFEKAAKDRNRKIVNALRGASKIPANKERQNVTKQSE